MKRILTCMLLTLISWNSLSSSSAQHTPRDEAFRSVLSFMPKSKAPAIPGLHGCEDDYHFQYRNRSIGILRNVPYEDGSLFWHFEFHYTLPQDLSPRVKTINDFMSKGWNDKTYVYGAATEKAFWDFALDPKTNLAELIRMDKQEGGVPWQVAIIQEYFESGAGKSLGTRLSNNYHGIKCTDHSDKWHKAVTAAAKAKGLRSVVRNKCVWVGGDDSDHDHLQRFANTYQSRKRHSDILMGRTKTSKRYTHFNQIPFNDSLILFTPVIARNKTVKFYGQKVLNRVPILITGADAWWVGLSNAVYATHPGYADIGRGIYDCVFKNWTIDDFLIFEHWILSQSEQENV